MNFTICFVVIEMFSYIISNAESDFKFVFWGKFGHCICFESLYWILVNEDFGCEIRWFSHTRTYIYSIPNLKKYYQSLIFLIFTHSLLTKFYFGIIEPLPTNNSVRFFELVAYVVVFSVGSRCCSNFGSAYLTPGIW